MKMTNNYEFPKDQFDMEITTDGTVILKKKYEDKIWQPEIGQYGVMLELDGTTRERSVSDNMKVLANHEYFRTKEDAIFASPVLARTRAYIKACRQVDVFEPDWSNVNSNKYFCVFDQMDNKWHIRVTYTIDCAPAYVSTRDKVERLYRILTNSNVYMNWK